VSNLLKKEKGFTLIEIVLVMAIAGLILVIVFLALQGAQKSRRDNARKHDAARMLAAVESCAGNQNGSYTAPLSCAAAAQLTGGASPYFNPNTDPDGTAYTIGGATQASATKTAFGIAVTGSPTCAGTTHPAVVWIGQESGTTYCVGN
jgi:prepilin-type N-terminal cleavage/methylation domain-containing protein